MAESGDYLFRREAGRMVAALTRLFGVHNLAVRTARTYTPELGRQRESEWTLAPTVAEAFGESAIRDGQLRMMFSGCYLQLPEVAQVALMLNILCGFGVNEVAAAFLTRQPAMEKWTILKLEDGTPNKHHYGFAWGIDSINGHRVIEHSGSWQGFEAHIARYVDDRVTIVVLMNLGGANPTRIAHGVAGLYRRGLSTPANTAGF